MPEKNLLTACAQIAREKDKDRFLVALTAPASAQEYLFALIAFNHEIAKTRDSVSETMLGQIRLQWWREAIAECYEGKPRRHEVVQPMHEAISTCKLSRPLLEGLIDAREKDLSDSEPADIDALILYARNTGGILNELFAEALGCSEEVSKRAARQIGTAWALVGTMRALPFTLRQKQILIPTDLLEKYGVDRQDLLELRNPDTLKPAVREICQEATGLIRQVRKERSKIESKALPALHLASFAESYLGQLEKAGYDTYSPLLAQPSSLRNLKLIVRHLLRRF
ncbi:phytoene/squalene synthase family protein [Aestuariispira insulae]|uniref:Phytoene synthase n=1 Tax=Aestuariispira insulae TaxID=1461337 RepID=A0A3D9HNJ7_9PROT|nr:phytoene/squalene synthase family protein [Aestuariispira insulae]RED51049.1 phytoene synthase [Aestuariispira insulae]